MELFRYFIRKNYADVSDEMTNEEIDEIGVDFHKHLDSILNDQQKIKVLPKDAVTVILQSDNPLMMNGFHPSYLLHFNQWVNSQITNQ